MYDTNTVESTLFYFKSSIKELLHPFPVIAMFVCEYKITLFLLKRGNCYYL